MPINFNRNTVKAIKKIGDLNPLDYSKYVVGDNDIIFDGSCFDDLEAGEEKSFTVEYEHPDGIQVGSTTIKVSLDESTDVQSHKNNWLKSDVRAYLNGLDDKSIKNSTTEDRSNQGYAKQHFIDAEYNLVQPWSYSTNMQNTSEYILQDRFLLPSANKSHNKYVISWGNNELRSTDGFKRLIPFTYWPSSNILNKENITRSWLRTPAVNSDHASIVEYGVEVNENFAGNGVEKNKTFVVAMFKVNLQDINFASAVSATSFSENGSAKRISDALPDYGMYLKKCYPSSEFHVSRISYSFGPEAKKIIIYYKNGMANNYIVIHAFKEDGLAPGTRSYAAVKKIENTDVSVTSPFEIDVTNWGSGFSLDGCTAKIWMEDGMSSSLATATAPQTFVESNGQFEEVNEGNNKEIKNLRVFATKNELMCSWGNLNGLSQDDYKRKVSIGESIIGAGATNQKIYFDTYTEGGFTKPLPFWIAGRETNNGVISSDGDIMCLYQAIGVDQMAFNKE